jgi:sulfur relay (sulfurtransferase) complex TusBCD TusD component (DsrE family)
VKILLIVSRSAWDSSLGTTALRLANTMPGQGLTIAAVYFRGEGVYQALSGRATDAGTPPLRDAWRTLAEAHDFPLLLCRSAAERRLPAPPGPGFREAGLAEVLELMSSCDRVVSF